MWSPKDKEPPEGIPDEKEEQYRVSIDWLLEAEEYNEWMCEEDYEGILFFFVIFVIFIKHPKLEWQMS